jgi:hypothetical protein
MDAVIGVRPRKPAARRATLVSLMTRPTRPFLFVLLCAAAIAAACGSAGAPGKTSSTTGSSSSGSTSSSGGGSSSSSSTSSSSGAPCPAPAYATSNTRGSDTPVYVNAATYDYSPTVMLDGGYRMWWCCGSTSGGVAGDHICYAEASSLDGPWHAHGNSAPNTHDEVFHGTGNVNDFDGTHTCDPSVLRVADGTYYMFYGGISENTPTPTWTRIGVASSVDGFAWTRLNGGKPIVDAARDPYAQNLPNKYGAGQPSVTLVDGLFYMIHTDTTGLGGNQGNGAGQYVLRSADPTFQAGVEELTKTGFVAKGAVPTTTYSLLEAFATDWQYSDLLDQFVDADDSPDGTATVIHFFDHNMVRQPQDVKSPGHWTEEPAIVSRPDKHAIPWGGACGTLSIDIVRSVGGSTPGSWDLAHGGVDVDTGLSCPCANVAKSLEGSLLAVPSTPLTLVIGGQRLQFALAAPAQRLARNVVDPGMAVFNMLPYAASVFSGNKVLGATGRPAAYLLDDGKLWPVSCIGEITDDQTSITSVSTMMFDNYPAGSSLYCLQ